MFNISYNIKISISIISSGKIVDLVDTFNTELYLADEQLYDNYHILWNGYILDLLDNKVSEYLNNNHLIRQDIDVESYEILSLTNNVDIFFENPINPTEYTLSPTVKAFIHPIISLIVPPTLNGKLINSNSIMWSWDAQSEKGFAHYLLDTDNKVIAQLPIDINYFIESELLNGVTYIRKLVKYNSTSSSKPSIPLSILTSNNIITTSLTTYGEVELETKQNRTFIDKMNHDVFNPSTTLSSFKLGIGDSNDLMISKQMDTEFYEKFGLNMKIYGTSYKEKSVYDQVSFNYKVKATGDFITMEQPGTIDIEVTAYPIRYIIYRLYRYGLNSVSGNYKISCDVHYCKKVITNITDTDGNPDVKTVFIDDVKTITSDIIPFTFMGTATYNPILGFATCDHLEESNAKILNNSSLYEIMKPYIDKDKDFTDSGLDYFIKNYQIFDDYSFNEADKRFNKNGIRNMITGVAGTLKVSAKYTDEGYLGTSKVYIYGFSEGCLFDTYKFVKKEISVFDGTKQLLSPTDLITPDLINIVDNSMKLNTLDNSIVSLVEVKYADPDIVIDSIGPIGSTCHIGASGALIKWQSDRLTYDFSTVDPYTMAVGCYIIKGIDMSNDIDPVTKKKADPTMPREYNFITEVFKTSGNIDIALEQEVIVGQKITGKGEANFGITMFANLVPVINHWESTLPNPLTTDPLFGIVNGRFNITTSFYGKCDFVAKMPTFIIPTNIIPASIKYSVELFNTFPHNCFVSSSFTNIDINNYGVLNGDTVTFKSDSMTLKKLEFVDLVETIQYDDLKLLSVKETTFDFVLNKPVFKNNVYEKFNLKVIVDNINVSISNFPDVITYDDKDECPLSIVIRGQENATSLWSPRIHNGYYYMNNHEHFLYSEFKVEGDFKDLEDSPKTFMQDRIDYTIDCTLKKVGGEITHYTINKTQEHDFISDKTLFDFQSGKLFPQPTLDSQYYKEYQRTIYTSSSIVLPKAITSYGVITWDNNIPNGTTLAVWMRSFDISKSDVDSWFDWVQVSNGSLMNLPLSSAVQLKVIFEPITTNVYTDFDEICCCELDYTDIMDTDLSTNISFIDDILKGTNVNIPAVFHSKVLHYGSSTTMKLSSYNNGKGIVLHVAGSNNKYELADSPNWVVMNGVNSVGQFRYLRYKIEIPVGGELYLLYKHVNAPVTTAYVPKIGNIQMSFTNVEEDKFYSFTQDFSNVIPFDTNWHIVSPTVQELIYPVIVTSGFEMIDIMSLGIQTKDDVSELRFDIASLDKGIEVRSLNIQYGTSLKSQYINFINNTCSLTGTPQQFCPVIVQDDNLGSLQLVSFIDEYGNPTLTNEEEFVSDGRKYFELKYNSIDVPSLAVMVDNKIIASTDYTLYNNVIEFNYVVNNKAIVSCSYKLENSFIVEINHILNTTKIIANINGTLNNTRIMFETNKTGNKENLDHLSFNPVYNIQNKGFVYLSYDTFPVYDFNVHANPVILNANAKDTVGVYVSLFDEYSNPVPGEEVLISCSSGRLDIKNTITDINGVVYMRYTSAPNACIDYIIVTCKSLNLTKSLTITNK